MTEQGWYHARSRHRRAVVFWIPPVRRSHYSLSLGRSTIPAVTCSFGLSSSPKPVRVVLRDGRCARGQHAGEQVGFEFAMASRLVFGAGTRHLLADVAINLGRRAFIVTGRSGIADDLVVAFEGAGVGGARLRISGEPLVSEVQAACTVAIEERCDLVVAIGGGSVIDTGKAIAALVANGGDAFDYLEVVGRGRPLTRASLPCVAVPTTAGSGAEVTRNAVLTVPDRQVKVSLRSPSMLPTVAVVDPELTYDLPPSLTASTGLDALAQLIEPYLSTKANPFTDAFCREGMVRVSWALLAACARGHDADARESMSLASLLGGMALANAGLGAVHGLAGAIGGRSRAPHGAVCAALLPHVLRENLEQLRLAAPESPILSRFDHVARLLTGDREASAEEGIAWIQDLCAACGIPGLAEYGLSPQDIPAVVEQARQSSSMRANPVLLSVDSLSVILGAAL